MTLTRESLHPLWASLSERVDVARRAFQNGGSEDVFRRTLKGLGFDWTGIEIEVADNQPGNPFRTLADIAAPIIKEITK